MRCFLCCPHNGTVVWLHSCHIPTGRSPAQRASSSAISSQRGVQPTRAAKGVARAAARAAARALEGAAARAAAQAVAQVVLIACFHRPMPSPATLPLLLLALLPPQPQTCVFHLDSGARLTAAVSSRPRLEVLLAALLPALSHGRELTPSTPGIQSSPCAALYAPHLHPHSMEPQAAAGGRAGTQIGQWLGRWGGPRSAR